MIEVPELTPELLANIAREMGGAQLRYCPSKGISRIDNFLLGASRAGERQNNIVGGEAGATCQKMDIKEAGNMYLVPYQRGSTGD